MAPSEHFHTLEEWDTIRPIFARLYQEERKKLDEVRRILEHRFNFPTTPKQCKTKIKEWNLGKYKKQKELLHAKRLINEGRRRGRHVDITLRGESVTLEDIAKHFKRKATDLDDLDLMIPNSPTPQELSWTSRSNSPEIEEIELDGEYPSTSLVHSQTSYGFLNGSFNTFDQNASQLLPASHDAFDFNAPPAHSCLRLNQAFVPRSFGIDSTERSFFSLRDLVESDFGDIRNTYPTWWTDLDNIVVDFDAMQFDHIAGRGLEAAQKYDNVLGAVTRYAQLPSFALLQFVSYLLSWSAIPRSGDVVRMLFQFLYQLKNQSQAHRALTVILPCLLSGPEHASCSVALFQDVISKYLTEQLGRNSITVLRMNLRLCRHVFGMDDQEPAWRALREISNLRKRCVSDTYDYIDPELDLELQMTLQLFDESIRAKTYLEDQMAPCSDLFISNNTKTGNEEASSTHCLCNFKLGLYTIAYKQARATLTCFRKVYTEDDSHIQEARALLDGIETFKPEFSTAGFIWPQEPEDILKTQFASTPTGLGLSAGDDMDDNDHGISSTINGFDFNSPSSNTSHFAPLRCQTPDTMTFSTNTPHSTTYSFDHDSPFTMPETSASYSNNHSFPHITSYPRSSKSTFGTPSSMNERFTEIQ